MHKHVVHSVLAIVTFQVGWGVEGFDFAIYHYRHAVAILCLVHIVGGDKHGDSAPGCTVYGLPKLLASIGIHTAGGLIEKHYARIVKNTHGKCQFLFPPQWQTLHEGIGLIAKLEACYHFFGFADYCTAIHTIYSAVEHQVFAHREVVVERKFLAHIAYVLFYLLALGGYIISAHSGFAGSGAAQSA